VKRVHQQAFSQPLALRQTVDREPGKVNHRNRIPRKSFPDVRRENLERNRATAQDVIAQHPWIDSAHRHKRAPDLSIVVLPGEPPEPFIHPGVAAVERRAIMTAIEPFNAEGLTHRDSGVPPVRGPRSECRCPKCSRKPRDHEH
jgi:hypothetical protein